MKHTLASILAGAAIAIAIVACGAAPKQSMTAAPGQARPDVAPVPGRNPTIEKAEAAIEAAMQKLELEHVRDAVPACAQPPCGADGMHVKPSTDPKCVHGTSQTCTDTCTLADSICENAETICKIAKELGNDAWANGKCAGAETSCEKARGKCCGCS